MSDGILIELAPGWALGFDPHQWMIETADIRCQQAVLRYRRAPWRPVAFIGSTKAVLRRCLSEKGIELTPKASEYIDAMPDTFRAWYRQYKRQAGPIPESEAA
jgi:hypothetical protein